MKRVAIIQARTGSSRLPQKVLARVGGFPMLTQVLARIRRCRTIDDVVVATTCNTDDDRVVMLAAESAVAAYRGSEHDVLDRFLKAAREARADVVVRITADCPLIDPTVIDGVVNALCQQPQEVDYASNVITRTYPRGLDTEAMYYDTLERLARRSSSPAGREHVTSYLLRERPELFSVRSIEDVVDNSDLRWTVDEPADLEMANRMYEELELGKGAGDYRQMLAYVRAHPDIARMNAHVEQKL